MAESVCANPRFMWEVDPENLALAMQRAGLNQSTLAEAVGMKQPSIARLLRGETKTTRALDLMAQKLQTSAAFLKGETDDPAPKVGEPRAAYHALSPKQPDNAVMIPQLEIGYSMGGGSVFSDYQQTAMVPFPREWLRPMMGGTFGDLFVARGDGDSMMPTLLDGDLCIVDTAQQTILQQDRLWCLSYGDLGMIKRVRMQPDGGALIISDNPAIADFTAYDDELHAVGRVIWIGRRV